MKKIISIALAVIMCMSMCVCAFADMGGPMVRAYTSTVTNPNGAKLYETEYDDGTDTYSVVSNVTIPCGEEIEIQGEYTTPYGFEGKAEFEGKTFGSVSYNDSWGYIFLDDIQPLTDTVAPTEDEKLDTPEIVYVMAEGGVKLYKGPSNLFEAAATVPKGAKLTMNYVDRDEIDDGTDTYTMDYEYYYTEYNGVKGWVYNSVLDETNSLVKSVNDYTTYAGRVEVIKSGLKLVDIYTKDGEDFREVGEEIPAGTVLSFIYYTCGNDTYAYTVYNGTDGFVKITNTGYGEDAGKVIVYVNDYMMTMDDCPVYSEAGSLESASGDVIPAYTKVQLVGYFTENTSDDDYYNTYSWYLVKADGKEEWICTIDEDGETSARADRFFCNETATNTAMVVTARSASVYASPDEGAEVINTLVKGDHFIYYVFDIDYDDYGNEYGYYYFEKDGAAGWVNTDDIEYDPDYKMESTLAVPTEEETESGGSEETAPEITTAVFEESEAAESALSSSSKTIVICIAAAVVIALVAVVSVALIKKKKSADIE